MAQYYSTFPAGFEPAIEEFIARDMPGVQLLRTLEGAVEYKRRGTLTEIPTWFNNTFLCLTTFARAPKDPIQHMVRLALTRGVDSETILNHMPDGAATFRAMFMVDGLISHTGEKTMAKAEAFLADMSGLRPGRALPDVEFWFLYRSKEGLGFLLMRLTYRKEQGQQARPGELRPDIASLLCRLTNPKPGETFLDPFAGSGGIARARLRTPAEKVIAGDIAPSADLRYALRGADNGTILKMDALAMADIPSGSVDAIACDPPWGDTMPIANAQTFYGKFAAEAKRVLKRGGRLVMLTALKKEAEEALVMNFALDGRLEVLVAGKKATVFICRNA